ncbi:MAG: alpha-glucosidase, partial [Actinomycetota bacterium]
CEQSVKLGDPVVRPLVYTWPEDPSARADELSYTLGPSILVAPVLDPTGRRTHYLPPGSWVDHFTGEHHEGGRWTSGTWPLESFPLYLREGAGIPETGTAPRAEDALR